MEPAAMLVRSFQIKIGWPFQIRALLQTKGMGGAGIEPDIEDVIHFFPFIDVVNKPVQEALLCTVCIPGVGALF